MFCPPDSRPDEVLTFWFETLKPRQWFRRDDALDGTIATRLDVENA